MTLTHIHVETDLDQAKDGRWVMLIEPDVGGDTDGPTWDDNHIPPVVVAKWVHGEGFGAWSHLFARGQGEGYLIRGAKGFVELEDLGLYPGVVEPDDSYVEVATDGTAWLVRADGPREPAPEGWDADAGLKARRLK